ncbi:hypothetical protein, partial [Halovulum sp. GXIMD14793]
HAFRVMRPFEIDSHFACLFFAEGITETKINSELKNLRQNQAKSATVPAVPKMTAWPVSIFWLRSSSTGTRDSSVRS